MRLNGSTREERQIIVRAFQVEQEFDDLFRDMDDVRKAVRRELEGTGGDGSYDAEVRVYGGRFCYFVLEQCE